MRRILVIGASHAKKLGTALKQFEIQGEFKVEIYAQPGARFANIPFPDLNNCTEQDVAIFICLGNDIFEQNSHQVECKNRNKTIHLSKNRPSSENHLLNICSALQKKIKNCRATCIIVDNFYKHLRCCSSHMESNRGMFSLQRRYNVIIRKFFATQFTVIPHTSLLFNSYADKRNEKKYRELQIDAVHFSPCQYLKIAARLLPRLFSPPSIYTDVKRIATENK